MTEEIQEIPGIPESIEDFEKDPILKPLADYNKVTRFLKKDVDSESGYLKKNLEVLNGILGRGNYATSMIARSYNDVLEVYKRLFFAYRNYSEMVEERLKEIKEILDKYYITKKEHEAILKKKHIEPPLPFEEKPKKIQKTSFKEQEEELEFFDIKTKKKFKTSNYEIIEKNKRRIAIAISPSGIKAPRFLGALKGSVSSQTIKKSKEPPPIELRDIEDD